MDQKVELLNKFNNAEFGDLRVFLVNNEPYFVGRDVALTLGYLRPRNAVLTHVDEEDRIKYNIPDNQGIDRSNVLINESGLYSLVLASKLPQARSFKRWVTSEVLPSIRQHGAYMSQQIIDRTLQDPDYLIQLATQIKQERALRKEAEEKRMEAETKRVEAEAVAQVYVKDNALKENIIQGLTQPIPLAKMRQHLNQVVITGTTNFAARWRLLYKEFDAKYHMRIADRMSNINYPGTRLDYIEKELKQLPDLFQLACVMFAESYDVVMAKWNAVKRNNYLDREINVKKTELNQNLNK